VPLSNFPSGQESGIPDTISCGTLSPFINSSVSPTNAKDPGGENHSFDTGEAEPIAIVISMFDANELDARGISKMAAKTIIATLYMTTCLGILLNKFGYSF
jgi:hypothetical protein